MGYEESPWVFKGRALYQLQLVKVSEARKYVPESLKLVSLFGYTLGGFYLARYTDSPVGAFDELVAVAGLVWNFPGSCAWAARVYVNDRTARNHGLQKVGLPSRQAIFEQDSSVTMLGRRGWWDGPEEKVSGAGSRGMQQGPHGGDGSAAAADHPLVLRNTEGSPWWRRQRSARGLEQPVCRLTLPPAPRGWPGPRMTILLPSFSGATEECPQLLKYTCHLRTNVSPIRAAALEVGDAEDDGNILEALAPVLRGRPLIAFNFHDMELSVKEPAILNASQRRISDKRAHLQTA